MYIYMYIYIIYIYKCEFEFQSAYVSIATTKNCPQSDDQIQVLLS